MADDQWQHDAFDDVFHDVLIENTAQTIYKRLAAIEHKRLAIQSRWIWELIQNARDASTGLNGLHVRVNLRPEELIFQHNGAPFKDREIAHLILHGTTKQAADGVGRFGTGFITTHLISRHIRVRGKLVDGRCFDFDLNRDGTNADELRVAMWASSEEFRASIDRQLAEVAWPFTTEFRYPLNEHTLDVVKSGMDSLRTCVPYLLAFNPVLTSVSIDDDGIVTTWTKSPATAPVSGTVAFEVACTTSTPGSTVIIAGETDVQVAMLIQGNPQAVSYPENVPKLFVAFPLSGTEKLSIPLTINSEFFEPLEERNGIHLGTNDDEANTRNMHMFAQACDCVVELAALAAERQWKDACKILRLRPPEAREWIEEKWFASQIRDRLAAPFRTTPLVLTLSGELAKPCDAWIPLGCGDAGGDAIWQVTSGLRAAAVRLPAKGDVADWDDNTRSWAKFLDTAAEAQPEGWTTQKLAGHVAALSTMEGMQAALNEGLEPLEWLNGLHRLLVAAGDIERLRVLSLIPNQLGVLKKADEIHLDKGIDEGLKDIATILGISLREELMDLGVTSPEVCSLLHPRSETDVLRNILDVLKKKAAGGPTDADWERANIAIFGWMLQRGITDEFDGFPALVQKDDEGRHGTFVLKNNASPGARPLGPVGLWPSAARDFAKLFPEQLVISDEYLGTTEEPHDWSSMQAYGFVHLAPLYEADSHAECFLADEALPDDQTGVVRSDTPVKRSEIAFLSGGEKNVIDRIRGSSGRSIKMVRFLLEYVLPTDEHALDDEETVCDDGGKHKYYHARWLEPLKERGWIAVGKRKNLRVSAETLALLLAGHEDLRKRLSEERPGKMFTVLGASPAEILLRSVGRTDAERVSLIQSLATISDAAGGDIAKVGAFAVAIASDPRLFQFVEEKKKRLDRVERNQKLGDIVEKHICAVIATIPGVKVTRTGTGHDYRLDPAVGEEDDAARIEISSGALFCFIEVKATSDEAVRMSVRQVEAAVANPDRYLLCVVHVADTEPSEAEVREHARFVTDIGSKVTRLWGEYQDLQDAMNDVERTDGDLSLEVSDQGTRFKVGPETWRAGIGFGDTARRLHEIMGVGA